MRKIFLLLTALVLCFSMTTAFAAPVRDAQNMEVPVSEPMQHMLNLLMSAAMLKDAPELKEGDAPGEGLCEAVFALFNYVESGVKSVTLSRDDCTALYSRFFASGEYHFPETSECPCVTFSEKGMTMDLSQLDETPLAGAYVYASRQEEDKVILSADVYTLWGYFSTPAADIPENDLTWWAGAEITLRQDESAPYGYTLISYALTDAYLDGLVTDWQTVDNEKCEYSVNLPSILGLADETDTHRAYQSGDGTVNVVIECGKALSYDDALTEYINTNADMTVSEEKDFAMFTAEGEGRYFLCVADENLPYVYQLTMTFPAERQAEFTLYAELIRNSMVVWGLNNG